MTTITEKNKKALEAMLTKKPAPQKPVAKKTRRKKRTTRKKAGAKRLKSTRIVIHPIVKKMCASIKEADKPMHSEETISRFNLEAFRVEVADGCKKCKGIGFVGVKQSFCACQNEICDGNFITWYDQFTYWYNSRVAFKYGRLNEKDKKGSSKKY